MLRVLRRCSAKLTDALDDCLLIKHLAMNIADITYKRAMLTQNIHKRISGQMRGEGSGFEDVSDNPHLPDHI